MSVLRRSCSRFVLLAAVAVSWLLCWSAAATADEVTIAVLGVEIMDVESTPQTHLEDSLAMYLSDWGEVVGISTWRVEALTGQKFDSLGEVLDCSECVKSIGEFAGAEWLVGGWVDSTGSLNEAGMWLVSTDKPGQAKTLSLTGNEDVNLILRRLSTQARRHISGSDDGSSLRKWIKYGMGAAAGVALVLILSSRGVFSGGDGEDREPLPRPPDRP